MTATDLFASFLYNIKEVVHLVPPVITSPVPRRMTCGLPVFLCRRSHVLRFWTHSVAYQYLYRLASRTSLVPRRMTYGLRLFLSVLIFSDYGLRPEVESQPTGCSLATRDKRTTGVFLKLLLKVKMDCESLSNFGLLTLIISIASPK